MEEVDAVDNGISQYDGEARYTVSTTLSARVSHLNPWWNSNCQDTEVSKEDGKSLSCFCFCLSSMHFNVLLTFLLNLVSDVSLIDFHSTTSISLLF